MSVTADDLMERMKLLIADLPDENLAESADLLEEKVAGWGFDTESIFELAEKVAAHHLVTSGYDIRQTLLSVFNSGFIMGVAGAQELELQRMAEDE